MPTTLLLAPLDFQSFLRPCDKMKVFFIPLVFLFPKFILIFLSRVRVTSLEQLSIAEFSGEYTRPKVLGIWFDLVLKVKYSKILIFKVIFLCQKSAKSL